MKIAKAKQRRDGKWMVSLSFSGGPNGFGGFYPGRIIRKIMTTDEYVATRKEVQERADASSYS